MIPWPFNYLPWPLNFLAIWTGYTILLVTAYCALIAILRWWVGIRYKDNIEEWARMREEAQKVRENLHGQK